MTVSLADPPAAAARLGDHAAPVVGDFGDREADPVDVGHFEPIGRDAAGDLRAALDQMPGDGRAGQAVPIVPRPAEPVGARGHGQAGIGHAGR